MENTEPVTTETPGTTPTEATELVRVEEATDEELDAHLAKADEPVAVKEEATDEPTEEAAVTEPGESEGEPVPAQKVYTEEEVRALQEELVKKRDQVLQQEQFIQRRSTELGQTRQQLEAANEQLQRFIQANEFENPAQAAQAVNQLERNQAQIDQLAYESEAIQYYHNWHKAVASRVDPKEVSLDDMAEVLRDQNIPEDGIAKFRQNPANFMDAATTINLAEAAKWRKKTKQLAIYAKQLIDENKKLKSKPVSDLKRIEAAARASVGVNGNSGSMSAASKPSSDPAKWSDAELNDFLKSQSA
jgi:hypothetical protein